MRLEEFPTKHKLVYTPGDIESMKKALEEYATLISSEKAFEDDYCIAHFYHSCDAIALGYFDDFPLAKNYLENVSFYYSESSDTDNLQAATTGEALFYLCAIKHIELKESVVKSCENIVAFSRKHNNSADMWLTCEHPFGVEALSILAHTYPEYGYLLASYLVPNWDDEHMAEPLHMLAQWSNPLGIRKETLKAYCYCDNARARENMLGYDTWFGSYDDDEKIDSSFDLLTYIRESAENFQELIEALSNRLAVMPSIDDKGSFVQKRMMEMMFVHHPFEEWDDDFDVDEYLTLKFIDTPADQAIESITHAIEEHLGHAIDGEEEKVEKKTRQVRISETIKWQDLVTKVLDQGQEIWNYVLEGQNDSILKNLCATDLVNRAKEESCLLADSLAQASSYSPLHENIDRIFRLFIAERLSIDTSFDKAIAKEESMRLYDLLHILMDKPVIDSHLVWLMSEHFSLASREDILQRYPSEWEKNFVKTISRINRFDSLSNNEGQILHDFYQLVNKDRHTSYENLKEHLQADLPEGIGHTSRLSKVTSPRTYALLALYIQRRDQEEGIEDVLTQDAYKYVDNYLAEYTLNAMSSDGKWASRPEAYSVMEMTYDAEYQIKYQKETLEKFALWKPLDVYLNKGDFKGCYGKKGHDEALHYFKENLQVEDDEVSQMQAQYALFSHNDDTILLINLLEMALSLSSFKNHDLYKRSFKLLVGVAPLYVTSHLYRLQCSRKSSISSDKIMANLEGLKGLGLPEHAYWVQMLFYHYESVKKSEIVDAALMEKYHLLMDLCFQNKLGNIAQDSAYHIFDRQLQEARRAMQEGCLYLPREDYLLLVDAAKERYGMTDGLQKIIDELAMDKMMRSLEDSFVRIPTFIENLFIDNDVEVINDPLDFDKLSKEEIKEKLECYNAKPLMDSEKDEINAYYKEHWSEKIVYVIRTSEGYQSVYNGRLLDMLYTEILENKYLSRYGLDCRIVEDCDSSYIQAIAPLESIDYKAFWSGHIANFLKGEIPFDVAKDLLRLATSDYEFMKSSYFDLSLGNIIMDLSRGLRNRILKTIACVDYKKLDIVRDDMFKAYFKMLYDANVDREALLKLLVYREDEQMVQSFALMTDCSIYLDALAISEQAEVIRLLASYPQYHPMIISLKKHKSKKIKDLVALLIKKHYIESEDQIEYTILDFGEYSYDQNKANFLPVHDESSNVIHAHVGKYFGLRFTASNAKVAPKVTVHSVTVKHPWINEEGKKTMKTSKWIQNGYNASEIFAGWFFDNEATCIAGKYTFKITDSNKNVMLEQAFKVIKE